MALTLDELLFESNAPPEVRRSDIETRFHLMCLNPSRHDLVEFLADRATRCQRAALPQAEDLLRTASEEHRRPDLEIEEFRDFVHGLAELSQVLAQLPAYTPKLINESGLAACCRTEFDQAALTILREGSEFRAGVAASVDPYRSELRAAIDRAIWMVHEGMHEVGVERQEILRDAQGCLNEVLDNPEAMAEPVLWFYKGWLSWKRNLDPDTSRHAFFQACLGASARKGILYWLSCRHLAYHQSSCGAFDSAFATAAHALKVRVDQPTLLEFARYAARAGHEREAAGALLRCISISPLAALDVFAEEEFAA